MNGTSLFLFFENSFLKDLKKNNNRDWFNANKDIYHAVMAEFENLVFHLINKIGESYVVMHTIPDKMVLSKGLLPTFIN
jgi:uncharacterized protein (DUF2461 family)